MPNVLRRRSSRSGHVSRGHSSEVGRLKVSHVGVTVQLTHVTTFLPLRPTARFQLSVVSLKRWICFCTYLGRKKGGTGFVRLRSHTLNHIDTELIPCTAAPATDPTLPPCPLVSARARGQVLSHGRHNWPNDWQVDTRAELWLWLPTRHFRGAHCANRTLSCDCVHAEQKEKQEET